MSSPRSVFRHLCLPACVAALAEIAERGDEVLREHAADIVARAAILLTDPSRIHFAKNAFRLLGRLGDTAHAKPLQDVIDNESLPQDICAAASEALQLINCREESAASIQSSTAECIMQRGKRWHAQRTFLLLTFGSGSRELDDVLMGSDLAVEAATRGAELKPKWARSAKVFVEGALAEHFKEQLCDRNLVIRPEDEGRLNAILGQLEYDCERCEDGATTHAGSSANQEREVSHIARRTFIEVPWPEEPPAARRRYYRS